MSIICEDWGALALLITCINIKNVLDRVPVCIRINIKWLPRVLTLNNTIRANVWIWTSPDDSITQRSYCLQIFPCKNITLNLFTTGLWSKWSMRHWADRRQTVNRVSPPQATCAITLNYTLCRIFYYLCWCPLRCCPTTSLIPHINSYITDLSQGSQVTGSSSWGRGTYQQWNLPDAKFIFLAVSEFKEHGILWVISLTKDKSLRSEFTSSEDLSARGLRELLCCPVFLIYVKICQIDGLLMVNQIRSPHTEGELYG